MTLRRAETFTNPLMQKTVFADWFQPMINAFEKVRYREGLFRSLPMTSFAAIGGLRQLLSINTMREQIQMITHFDENVEIPPVPRSTWSDALSNTKRREVLRGALHHLVAHARVSLPDKLDGVKGIGERPVMAMDATYQKESSHFNRVLPAEGGEDNQKGHMYLTYYDLRKGIPVNIKTETASMGEMRVLKEDEYHRVDWSRVPKAIYAVDRAFVDSAYWDERKAKAKITVVTRMKSSLAYTQDTMRDIPPRSGNENVISDHEIQLQNSKARWRLIRWSSPEGIEYEYLSNDFDLDPGVLAFIYHRRWDEEKFFDSFKNDLANEKAWGKSPVAIDQQGLFAMMTYLLTRLFLEDQYSKLGLADGDTTQKNKYAKKREQYLELEQLRASSPLKPKLTRLHCDDEEDELLPKYDAYRAFYDKLSKIPLQSWRFLKNCFAKKSSQLLYERQLKPILLKYL